MEKSLIDGAYHSAVISGLVLASVMAEEKLLKIKPPNLGKLDVKDVGIFALNVFVAEMAQSWLVKQKIIPDSISPKPP